MYDGKVFFIIIYKKEIKLTLISSKNLVISRISLGLEFLKKGKKNSIFT